MVKKLKYTQKEVNRMIEIYEEATGQYISKNDVDVLEYIEEEKKQEYRKLYIKINAECPFCGENEKECSCYQQ